LVLHVIKIRSGLVVVERGWWDILVDPKRYRLTPTVRLVRLLGRLLPAPDLVLLLDAPAAEIHRRKRELSEREIAAQLAAWRAAVPPPTVTVPITGDASALAAEAREAISLALEGRALKRLGAGWASLPARSSPRWLIPRGPRGTVRSGLRAYSPLTLRAQAGWHSARIAGSLGVGRLLPRGNAPASGVRELLRPYLPAGGTYAISTSIGRPDRLVALVLDDRGREVVAAKVALDASGRSKLEHERRALDRWAAELPEPLTAPVVVGSQPGLLVLEAVPWRPRVTSWRLSPDVAEALGAFHARTSVAHGDFAPWNLLKTSTDWVLIDWEDAGEAPAPFQDIVHFLRLSSELLGRPTRRVLSRGMRGSGWVGRALAAYAGGAGIEVCDLVDALAAPTTDTTMYSRVTADVQGPS
jgi:hypothetical protein